MTHADPTPEALRALAAGTPTFGPALRAAADRIEALERENAGWRSDAREWSNAALRYANERDEAVVLLRAVENTAPPLQRSRIRAFLARTDKESE